ncbi:mediator of rna polymerase ii transcription [Trichuris trichiura]|uniref:Mediator of RNA polymerase II transcription subunit 13 n=1 Tax=Trichuris trichiura TaxID=36087 RepID=A0A077ZDD7_TRITR|nr:mediator of rna polymerase ii transcription [Trichuris trichiura]
MIFNDVAEDPVLCAYGRCITQGYLCVWRRLPPVHTSNKIDLRLAAEKELWIFWYGDEPDWGLLCTSLTKIEESSWEKGVEYETRTMLFKALHNQIDRVLLNSGYLRFGKWYAHPLEYPRTNAKNARSKHVIAFCFAFFVHGENNVCVTVSVQRHMPIYRLCRRAFANNPRQAVILAPWSISGEVNVDPECSAAELDAQSQECLQEWLKFYAFPDGVSQRGSAASDSLDKEMDGKSGAVGLPKIIDVIVRGVKLKYPTRFVGLTFDEPTSSSDETIRNGLQRTTGDTDQQEAKEDVCMHLSNLRHLICEKVFEGLVANQRCATEPSPSPLPPAAKELPRDNNESDSCTQPTVAASASSPDESVGAWEFLDISQNDPCRCREKVGIFCHLKCFQKKGQTKCRTSLGKHGLFHRRRDSSINPSSLSAEPTDEEPLSDGSYFGCSVGAVGESDATTFKAQCRTGMVEAAPSPVTTCNDFDAVQISHSKVEHTCAISYVNNDYSLHHRQQQQQQQQAKQLNMENALVAPRFSGAELAKVNSRLLAKSQYYWKQDAESKMQIEETEDVVDTPRDVVSDEFYRHLSTCHWYESDNATTIPLAKKRKKIKLAVHLSDVASSCVDPCPFSAGRSDCYVLSEQDKEMVATDEFLLCGQPSSHLVNPTFEEDAHASEGGILNGAKKESVSSGQLGVNDFDSCALISYGDPIPGTNCSDNEDDPLNAFLSPPPSHSQEEDSVQKPTPKAKQQPECNNGVDMQMSSRCTPSGGKQVTAGGGSATTLDHLGVIYPTPPSQEAVHQMSPEMINQGGAPLHCSGQEMDQCCKDEISWTGRSDLIQSGSKRNGQLEAAIAEETIMSKFLLASSFSSLDSSSLRRGVRSLSAQHVYKPSKLLPSFHGSSTMGHLLPTQPYAIGSTSQGCGGPFMSLPLGQQYTSQLASLRGGIGGGGGSFVHSNASVNFESPNKSIISAPASVRSFSEQSPSTLLNPPSVSSPHFVKTPRTPGADLQSPMSNASSAYARNLSSIEPVSCDFGHTCEGHGLVLALLISDTFIDLHRDSIFDSCPLCVCNMNIRGLEMGFYVNPVKKNDQGCMSASSHWTNKCTCGFSAVRHRYLSYMSGVFYEDEDDATGSVWQRLPASQCNAVEFCRDIVELVRHQSLIPDLTCSLMTFRPSLCASIRSTSSDVRKLTFTYNAVEMQDITDLCKQALEQSVAAIDSVGSARQEAVSFSQALINKWGYSISNDMSDSLETMALLRSLLPLLQESLQKPRGLWQAKHSVEGPLTWRQLHRKCSHRPGSNGREDLSGPEPIPQLLVGCDREWISVSPFSVRLWDRLCLEPFAQPKDVVFIAVVPDSHYVVRKARNFFRELSRTYEAMRLGRHCPITRVLKDGIMRVGKTHAKQLNQKPVDSWFDQFESSADLSRTIGIRHCSKLKLYAQVCRHYLAPHIFSPIWNAFDRSVFSESAKDCQQQANPECSSMLPPPAPLANSANNETNGSDYVGSDGRSADHVGGDLLSGETNLFPHVVVIYLVNPFNFESEEKCKDLNRLVTTGLFRCYLEILQDIPAAFRGCMQLQIIPLQSLLDMALLDEWEGGTDTAKGANRRKLSSTSHFRALALSVFMQIRSIGFSCLQPCMPKVLTGFGPLAGRAELFRRKQDFQSFRLFSAPVILMPRIDRASIMSSVNPGELKDDLGQVLFLTYCLSYEQQWLLSTVTDHLGSMLDSCVINMILNDRKNVVQREVIWTALRRLWDFVVGILATSSRPWRIVIGRFGRLGHEELKAWAHLLSKSQLRSTSRLLREQCSVCQPMPSIFETPAILSACLISTELDPSLRIFPDSFVHDDRFGQNAKQCPLSTPDDVTCTHIMVFPTSALIQINQCCIMTGGLPGTEESEGDFESLWKDLMIGSEGDGLESGLNDLFGSITDTSLMNDNSVNFDSTAGHGRVRILYFFCIFVF